MEWAGRARGPVFTERGTPFILERRRKNWPRSVVNFLYPIRFLYQSGGGKIGPERCGQESVSASVNIKNLMDTIS